MDSIPFVGGSDSDMKRDIWPFETAASSPSRVHRNERMSWQRNGFYSPSLALVPLLQAFSYPKKATTKMNKQTGIQHHIRAPNFRDQNKQIFLDIGLVIDAIKKLLVGQQLQAS
eukprot:scaffold5667_cov92-Cylindrotheca_fusiformis.AAC.5